MENMRLAVNEARLQRIYPFCLTIDRQAATYLPAVFGVGHYALLTCPERLPAVLLEWLRHLVTRRDRGGHAQKSMRPHLSVRGRASWA